MKYKVGDLFLWGDKQHCLSNKPLQHMIITKITGNFIWYAYNSDRILFRQRHVFEKWIRDGIVTAANDL